MFNDFSQVLEVNASSQRGGRQVVAKLQEATQSHHVHKKKENNDSLNKLLGNKSITYKRLTIVI